MAKITQKEKNKELEEIWKAHLWLLERNPEYGVWWRKQIDDNIKKSKL